MRASHQHPRPLYFAVYRGLIRLKILINFQVEYSIIKGLSECFTVRILQENSVSPYITIYIVEVAGVEPASEIKIQKTSTHIFCFYLA